MTGSHLPPSWSVASGMMGLIGFQTLTRTTATSKKLARNAIAHFAPLSSWRSRRLEVVGTRKKMGAREGDTRGVSPSRAPVLSFAYYFQATWWGKFVMHKLLSKHHDVLCVFFWENPKTDLWSKIICMDSSLPKKKRSEKGLFTKTTAYPRSPRDEKNGGKKQQTNPRGEDKKKKQHRIYTYEYTICIYISVWNINVSRIG